MGLLKPCSQLHVKFEITKIALLKQNRNFNGPERLANRHAVS